MRLLRSDPGNPPVGAESAPPRYTVSPPPSPPHEPLMPRFLRRLLITLLPVLTAAGPVPAETWRGLVVAPEDRCEPYCKDHCRSLPAMFRHGAAARRLPDGGYGVFLDDETRARLREAVSERRP